MPERTISSATYLIVCAVLVGLTFLTVGVSFIPLPGVWHIVLGLTIALCKASLVVLFFMHALLSSRVTWAVIAVASFWLGILLVLTLSDYFTRGMVPFTPGH
jgi:cytochrome c oxidase subunit 4